MDWRGEEYMGFKPTSHDWARLAAYIDGEGSINFSMGGKGKEEYSPTLMARLCVTNTDPRLIKWCVETFGMSWNKKDMASDKRGRQDKWKPAFFAICHAYRAAWVATNCLPWFILKREQAEVLIDHQNTTQVGLWKRGVARKTPQDILQYRSSLKTKMHQLNRRGPTVNAEAKEA